MTDLPPLHSREVPPQFPRNPNCKLAFIGEAPGDAECEKLRPFAGPAGRVFNAMLRVANIDRAECFVGNVFSHKLEENDARAHRKLIGEEAWGKLWENNIARLAYDLDTAQPTVLVPMGATALLATKGMPSISALRGAATYGVGPFAKYKLFPTLDPAHVLRQWTAYHVVIGDMIRALKQAHAGPRITWPKRELLITPTIEEVESFLAECSTAPLLSCDIETGWGQVRGMSFAPTPERAIYVPFISLDAVNRSYWQDEAHERRAWRACKTLLEGPTPKLGQNFGNYDVIWLLRKMGIRVMGFGDDLRLLHKALYPELPASLAFMGSSYSEQGTWKTWGKEGTTMKEREVKRDE